MARVLMLFYEPSWCGQATHILSLIKGLDRDCYEARVAYPQHHSAIGKTLAEMGIPAVALPMRRINNLGAAVMLLRLIREEPLDLLHVHGHEAGLWGRIVGRLAGVPGVIYTPHTLHSGILGQRAYTLMEWALAPLTDAWVAVNNADRLALIERGIAPSHKVSTIYNGIDFSSLPKSNPWAARRSLGLPEDVPVAAQVGRIATQKGPSYFLQAAALALEGNPHIRFLVVGDGPLKGKMERLARRLGIAQSVLFLGWRKDAGEIMASANTVVLSSLWEGLPYVLLEAMALGKPVIATNVGGNSELVEHERTGLLVPPRDPKGLAQAVLAISSDPFTAQRMGQAGMQRAREHFSLEQMTKLTQRVYDSLLRSPLARGLTERAVR